MKIKLTDILKSINVTKEYIFNDDNTDLEDSVEPFVLSHCFMHRSTVLYANCINRYSVDKKQLYDYYFYGLPIGKRYNPWIKLKSYDTKDIEFIQNIYGYSKFKSMTVLDLLTEKELKQLKEDYIHGI